jgi:hypothetical protein
MLIALAPNDLACDVASPIAQQEYNARDDIRLPTSNTLMHREELNFSGAISPSESSAWCWPGPALVKQGCF